MILIKNAQVFAPKALDKKDVLLAYDKILEIADCIEPWRDDLTVIDAAGKMLVPGFIDQHVHIVGGGGEGGFNTRTPEFQLSKAVTSGVTTLVGLLGTDGYTKSPELLLAKPRRSTTRVQNPDDRDRPPVYFRFRAFAADFPAKRRACRPLVAGSKPFWLLEYFRIKFYLPFLDSFIGKGTGSGTLWFWPAWGC